MAGPFTNLLPQLLGMLLEGQNVLFCFDFFFFTHFQQGPEFVPGSDGSKPGK